MDINKLKLYNKYKHINFPNMEFIYIGIDSEDLYWFLIKDKNSNTSFLMLKGYGFDPDKIVKDLNLEIGVYSNDDKYIKDYNWRLYSKKNIEIHFKPILKDKLKNIINR